MYNFIQVLILRKSVSYVTYCFYSWTTICSWIGRIYASYFFLPKMNLFFFFAKVLEYQQAIIKRTLFLQCRFKVTLHYGFWGYVWVGVLTGNCWLGLFEYKLTPFNGIRLGGGCCIHMETFYCSVVIYFHLWFCQPSIAVVLGFIGCKMILDYFGRYTNNTTISVLYTFCIFTPPPRRNPCINGGISWFRGLKSFHWGAIKSGKEIWPA